MSVAETSEVEAGRARRRIVAPARSAEAPLAVIVREPEQRAALEEQLGRRRVVVFPSLAHFCSDPPHKQRWAGILVARSCAWDAQLDRYVPYREYVGLYLSQEEGYGWPASVKRLSKREELEAWLKELEVPPPRVLEKLQSKKRRTRVKGRQGEAVTERHQLELLSAESSAEKLAVPSDEPSGAPTAHAEIAAPGPLPDVASAAQSASAPTAPSQRGRPRAAPTERVARAPLRERASSTRSKPRKSTRSSRVAENALDIEDIIAGPRTDNTAKERELMRIAAEIGLHRARELLERVRSNAHALVG